MTDFSLIKDGRFSNINAQSITTNVFIAESAFFDDIIVDALTVGSINANLIETITLTSQVISGDELTITNNITGGQLITSGMGNVDTNSIIFRDTTTPIDIPPLVFPLGTGISIGHVSADSFIITMTSLIFTSPVSGRMTYVRIGPLIAVYFTQITALNAQVGPGVSNIIRFERNGSNIILPLDVRPEPVGLSQVDIGAAHSSYFDNGTALGYETITRIFNDGRIDMQLIQGDALPHTPNFGLIFRPASAVYTRLISP